MENEKNTEKVNEQKNAGQQHLDNVIDANVKYSENVQLSEQVKNLIELGKKSDQISCFRKLLIYCVKF